MKNKISILALLLFFFCPLSAFAQEEWEGVAARVSAGVKWRVIPKLSLSATYQLRTQPNFTGLDRQSIAASVSYKCTGWLSVGTGYSFLAAYADDGSVKPKNRCYLDVTGSVKSGDWKFSLKEKLQFTNKDYSVNQYEQVQNDLALKNVFTVTYSGFDKLEPYASIEAKVALNGPDWTYEYDETTGTYINPQFNGYKAVYLSRVRPIVGVEWMITKNHGLDFRLLCDFFHNQKIKASTDGKELSSVSWKNSIKLSTSIGYTFYF